MELTMGPKVRMLVSVIMAQMALSRGGDYEAANELVDNDEKNGYSLTTDAVHTTAMMMILLRRMKDCPHKDDEGVADEILTRLGVDPDTGNPMGRCPYCNEHHDVLNGKSTNRQVH